MGRFHELNGRRGYFLVVTIPHMEGEESYSGGFESDCLTPENADYEADHLNGLEKAIFWQYCDEQPEKLGAPVRHFVHDLTYTAPVPDAEKRKELYKKRAEIQAKNGWQSRDVREINDMLTAPPARGTWAACECYIAAHDAAPGRETDRPRL